MHTVLVINELIGSSVASNRFSECTTALAARDTSVASTALSVSDK